MRDKEKEMEKEEALKYVRRYRNYTYKVSEDMISVGDWCYNFEIAAIGGHPLLECDSQKLVNMINNSYEKSSFIKRISAKIVATDDPTLIASGVPEL